MAPPDGHVQPLDCAASPLLQAMPSVPDLASRSVLQDAAVQQALCIDTMCDVDETAEVEPFEPLRKINLGHGTAPPRRYYPTFWRSLAFRLTKLEGIKRRQQHMAK